MARVFLFDFLQQYTIDRRVSHFTKSSMRRLRHVHRFDINSDDLCDAAVGYLFGLCYLAGQCFAQFPYPGRMPIIKGFL